jgi:hypothetical protein
MQAVAVPGWPSSACKMPGTLSTSRCEGEAAPRRGDERTQTTDISSAARSRKMVTRLAIFVRPFSPRKMATLSSHYPLIRLGETRDTMVHGSRRWRAFIWNGWVESVTSARRARLPSRSPSILHQHPSSSTRGRRHACHTPQTQAQQGKRPGMTRLIVTLSRPLLSRSQSRGPEAGAVSEHAPAGRAQHHPARLPTNPAEGRGGCNLVASVRGSPLMVSSGEFFAPPAHAHTRGEAPNPYGARPSQAFPSDPERISS